MKLEVDKELAVDLGNVIAHLKVCKSDKTFGEIAPVFNSVSKLLAFRQQIIDEMGVKKPLAPAKKSKPEIDKKKPKV